MDRIVLVNEGRIIMDDTPDAVLASGILPRQGIREPLYVTACRYAGIRVTAEMKPSSLSTMDLSKCRAPLQAWYDANKVRTFPVENEPLLEVKNVSFSYNGRKKVLQNVSFSVNAGEMVSIVGKNGAGKSTLSQIIVGFLNPDEGQVTLKGEDLARYTISERAEYVGLVLQNPNQMISKAMIFDEIAFGLRIRHVDEEEVKERVYQVMKICGLYPMRSWPISALSYGQKKRVTIASILVLNPKVLILDEPTAGQDYYHYSEIMSFLKTLNENGQTIILITHDMHLMLEYTERAIVLCESRKLADEKAYEVLCDRQLSTRANLKETSLFTLAEKAGIDEPQKFVECFIDYDRKEREKSCR